MCVNSPVLTPWCVCVYVCLSVCLSQSTQERVSELRRYADSLETDARRAGAENEARTESMTSQLVTSQQELESVRERLRQAEKERQESDERWKTDNDRLQVCPSLHCTGKL